MHAFNAIIPWSDWVRNLAFYYKILVRGDLMFIKYGLKAENYFHEQGIINTMHMLRACIEKHGEQKCLVIYYIDSTDDLIFMGSNDKLFYEVYDAFVNALRGLSVDIPGVGYFLPFEEMR